MQVRQRPRGAHTSVVASLIAAFLALGGGVFAAITLPDDSVGATQHDMTPGRGATTLKLIGSPVYVPKVLPDGATTVGTRRVFSEELYDKRTGQHVGQHSGTCTLVREPAWWLCHAGWTLRKVGPGARRTGALVAGALFDFAAEEQRFKAAIFGGTGDFDTARGEIAAAPAPGTDDWEYIVEIVN
jgi:hypothetical protein